MITMKQAINQVVAPNELVVFGTSENASFDPIWGGDQDWAFSLEQV